MFVCLPVDVHHVGSIEHVLLVKHLFIQFLPDTVIDVGIDVPEHLEVQILTDYLTVVYAVFCFLMEGCPHVEVEVVHFILGYCRSAQNYTKQCD